jgi:hypothetical protein
MLLATFAVDVSRSNPQNRIHILLIMGGRDVAAVCSKIIKVVVDLGTLFGGRVVGCAREDVRDPAGQPKRMGTMFSKMRLARGVE